ncbi:hypothetical protein RO3G_03545 [Rhizopus delemar RA 99-880]|uniref:ATP-dependent DNA helicase n=1 Tax=Rhizopus delemar (strain RA 99-880 / ATCC MYA-4621 / FGSC 9543 / NRRL 43880) TaxID=246409 RepID=I1BRL0_RHIO9|nr:hypothetical protein RO3G_03545 [Rhizopus delemar RA 99-880]|eukprot:EIE78840.1 hypothetical protein RO3G_03545 [Rhizopus delemar RA 99-880]
MANQSQKCIFSQITTELELNSTVVVSGAAGTGKSYLLRMLERYYKLQNCKVFKLAPTGVAAHNISGQTIHRFFGLTNISSVPNFLVLNEYVKLYPKVVLLIDECSMVSAKLLESINDALVKTTQRTTIMGGIKTIFFGDYCSATSYSAKRGTVYKSQLPLSCLRLYTTRERVVSANEKDYAAYPGDGTDFLAQDFYVGNERTLKIALRETRLLDHISIKPNMPVMLIHNLHVPTGWVNGTNALVECMEEENICLKKRLPNGNDAIYWIQCISRQVPSTSYTRTQFPIVPAFATTIHKAQSATIDCVGIHLDSMLSHGQLYVAMSRVRKMDDLYLFGAETPLNIKRKFDADINALDIVKKKCV